MNDAVETCAHHWVLAPASGPRVLGTCRLCGAVREYRTSQDEDSAFGRKKVRAPRVGRRLPPSAD